MDLFETLGLGPRPLSDNVVFYCIFPDKLPTDAADASQLDEFYTKCHSVLQPLLSQGYIWQIEKFNLHKHTLGSQAPSWLKLRYQHEKKGKRIHGAGHQQTSDASHAIPPCLYGSLRWGDNVEDEWMVVGLIRAITEALPNCSAQVWDNDGEFLLIEAAYGIPRWLRPDTAQHRVWFRQGSLHVIPQQGPRTPHVPIHLNLQEALRILREGNTATTASKANKIISERLSGFPGVFLQSGKHRSKAILPLRIALILEKDQQIVSAAVEAFFYRDADDMKAMQKHVHFPPHEQRVMTVVASNRCQYAQLLQQRYQPPRGGYALPPPGHPDEKAGLLGAKLTAGFEILAARTARTAKLRGKGVSFHAPEQLPPARATSTTKRQQSETAVSQPSATIGEPILSSSQPANDSSLHSSADAIDAPKVVNTQTSSSSAEDSTNLAAAAFYMPEQPLVEKDVSGHPSWSAYKSSLQRLNYFQGELEGSKLYRQLMATAVQDFAQAVRQKQEQKASGVVGMNTDTRAVHDDNDTSGKATAVFQSGNGRGPGVSQGNDFRLDTSCDSTQPQQQPGMGVIDDDDNPMMSTSQGARNGHHGDDGTNDTHDDEMNDEEVLSRFDKLMAAVQMCTAQDIVSSCGDGSGVPEDSDSWLEDMGLQLDAELGRRQQEESQQVAKRDVAVDAGDLAGAFKGFMDHAKAGLQGAEVPEDSVAFSTHGFLKELEKVLGMAEQLGVAGKARSKAQDVASHAGASGVAGALLSSQKAKGAFDEGDENDDEWETTDGEFDEDEDDEEGSSFFTGSDDDGSDSDEAEDHGDVEAAEDRMEWLDTSPTFASARSPSDPHPHAHGSSEAMTAGRVTTATDKQPQQPDHPSAQSAPAAASQSHSRSKGQSQSQPQLSDQAQGPAAAGNASSKSSWPARGNLKALQERWEVFTDSEDSDADDEDDGMTSSNEDQDSDQDHDLHVSRVVAGQQASRSVQQPRKRPCKPTPAIDDISIPASATSHRGTKSTTVQAGGATPMPQHRPKHTEKIGEDEFMEAYEEILQEQLAGTTLTQTVIRAPGDGNGGQTTVNAAGVQGQTSHPEPSQPTQAETDFGSIKPLDLDFNLVQNLLKSVGGQQGLAGPASNLAGMLGLHIPQSDSYSQSDSYLDQPE